MEKITTSMVIEILGRPKEHVKEAIESVISRLGAEKGVEITSKTIHEPIPAKDSETLFTTFAEIEATMETIENYFGVIFAYMPSHIEIITPQKLTISNDDFAGIGNKLLQRLHEYDSITKTTLIEKEQLTKKLYEVAPHLFKKPEEPKKEETPKKTKKKSKSKAS